MTDYAIRVIRAISLDEEETVTSIKIAEKENIQNPILMKVLRKLNQHGIVKSSRGRGDSRGGFSLVKSPKEITLLDIISIMEEDVYINECVKDSGICCNSINCKVHKEFLRINDVIRMELSRRSIYEIISEPLLTISSHEE